MNATLRTALAAALVAVASAVLIAAAYRNEATIHRAAFLARAHTVSEALAAGIRAQSRMGRYRADRLEIIFDEFTTSKGILAVALRTADGTPVAGAGDAAANTQLPPNSERWEPGRLTVVSQPWAMTSGGPQGMGRGRGPQAMHDAEAWDATPLVLAVVMDTADLDAALTRARTQFTAAGAIAIALCALGAWTLIARQRHRILEAGLVRAQAEAAQSARLAQLGAGLAHETKNPLGIVRGLAQSITNLPDIAPEVRAHAEAIVDEADRTVGHINAFLTLARPAEPELAEVALAPFFAELLGLLQTEAQDAEVALSYTGPDISVRADPALLRRAMLNLTLNALRASTPGGHIAFNAHPTNGTWTLTCRDSGCGIAPEDLPRVTEPYFSRFENGTGLGLAIVDAIARAHGWRLAIESTSGEGTCVALNGVHAAGSAP